MSEELMRVVLIGANGKMGTEAVRALAPEHGFQLVGAIVRRDPGQLVTENLATETDLDAALDRARPDAVIDLSLAASARTNAQATLTRKIPYVSGVTGLSEDDLAFIRGLTSEFSTPAMVVPNFAIGAVLMMRFAEMAAKWIPDSEIIELHHERKLDAPSGTAMMTAQRIAAARSSSKTVPETKTLKTPGARGGEVEGVPVHSIRLPGLLAHQEILFGSTGELLTIRHDASDRGVYMPGVRLCLKSVGKTSGLTIGMDAVLD